MWSRSEGFNPGSVEQLLDFSESRELMDFLSASPVPDDRELFKRVYSTAGWSSVGRGTAIRKYVSEWASALPYRLADLSIRWEGLLTCLEVRPRSPTSARSGNRGAADGEVAVLILSTSKRNDPVTLRG
jgi:hypothetical protein